MYALRFQWEQAAEVASDWPPPRPPAAVSLSQSIPLSPSSNPSKFHEWAFKQFQLKFREDGFSSTADTKSPICEIRFRHLQISQSPSITQRTISTCQKYNSHSALPRAYHRRYGTCGPFVLMLNPINSTLPSVRHETEGFPNNQLDSCNTRLPCPAFSTSLQRTNDRR